MYYAGMQWFAIICLEFHFQNLPSFTWMSAALLYTQSNLLFFSHIVLSEICLYWISADKEHKAILLEM